MVLPSTLPTSTCGSGSQLAVGQQVLAQQQGQTLDGAAGDPPADAGSHVGRGHVEQDTARITLAGILRCLDG
jgi:hypothetical protein